MKSQTRIRILLADDHPVVREGLKTLIHTQPDMVVVGEAEDGSIALVLAQQLKPDVVVMDLSMPNLNGIEATRMLTRSQPESRVVALTFFEDETYIEQAAAAGAWGYITKRSAPDYLIDALRLVASGATAFGLGGSGRRRESVPKEENPPAAPPVALDAQELPIVRLIVQGRTNSEIAAELKLDPESIEIRKLQIMAKLNLRSRAELARVAREQGWL